MLFWNLKTIHESRLSMKSPYHSSSSNNEDMLLIDDMVIFWFASSSDVGIKCEQKGGVLIWKVSLRDVFSHFQFWKST